MYKRLCFLISFVFVLSLVSTSYSDVVIGNFEGSMDGWAECTWNSPGHPILSFSTTGVTLGSSSLKAVQPTGWYWFIIKTTVNPADFMANNILSIDITRLASEWTRNPDPNQAHWCDLDVRINATGLPTTGLGNAGAWDSNNPDPNATRTVTWDYTLVRNHIPPNPTSVQIIIATNTSGYTGSGTWYLDNILLKTSRDDNPRNGAWGVLVNPVLRWKDLPPAKYDVYFGTDFNDVNDANRTSDPCGVLVSENQDPNYYPLAGTLNLDYGTTYYWRIDDVTGVISKGEVWHFTTIRLGGKDIVMGDWEQQMDGWVSAGPNDPNIELSYSTTGATLNNYSLTVDVPDGWHETVEIPLIATGLIDQLLANNRFSLDVTWVTSEWTGGGWVQIGCRIIKGDGIGWNQIDPIAIGDTSNPDNPGSWRPDFGDDTRTITWDYSGIDFSELPDDVNEVVLIIGTNSDIGTSGPYHFDNAQLFNTAARASTNPNPTDYATDVRSDPTLSWSPGMYAATHDIYFGTDFNNVNNASRSEPCGVLVKTDLTSVSPNTTYDITEDVNVGLLEFDTTYYWRIDDVYGEDIWQGSVWRFTTAPVTAHSPHPPNDAQWISIYSDVSWSAGFYAQGHKVYFDPCEAKVQARSSCQINGVNCVDPCYSLPTFERSTTYYWAIDEVNETGPDPCFWQGEVWNFKTVPVLPMIEGQFAITYYDNYNYDTGQWDAWGDYNTPTQLPLYVWNDEYLVNFTSGKTEATSHYLLSINEFDLRGGFTSLDVPPHPFDPDEDWNPLKSIGDDVSGQSPHHVFAAIFTGWVYFEEGDLLSLTSDDDSYIFLDDDMEWGEEILSIPYASWFDYVELTIPAELAGYHWITVKFAERFDQNSGIQINLNGEPLRAALSSSKPSPANNATDVVSDPTLSWLSGKYAVTHDVYFGTDETAVTDANRTSDPCGVLVKQDHDSNSIYITDFVGTLEFDTTYYWRIDDINMAGPDPCIWKGQIWSFTTASYQVMDDFEGYTDLTIGDVWHSSGGSYVTTATDVNGQIHSGDEAMAIGYDDASPPYYSEVYTGADTGGLSSLDFGSDWFPKGVKILSLWFHGIEDLRGSYTGTDPYMLTGDGSGIIGTSDSFYYFYRQANQITGRVQARVDSMECGMAGVMLRDDLNPDSVYAATVVTPDNKVIFMGRGIAGGNASAIATVSGITIPHWVRIKRSGTPAMIVAEHSSDGSTWSQIGPSLPWPITSPIYLGLCVTSNSYGDMCTAGFSNVEMQCPVGTVIADPDTGIDVGIPYNAPEPMYVGLEDNSGHSAFVSYPDPDATQIGVWMRWLINLNDFTDVNLADVKRMYIGFGDRGNPAQGGSGTVFIDDIRLLALCFPECHPDYDEWVNVGKPDCWCYRRQCHGDTDNAEEGSTKNGYYYVHFNDLSLLQRCWNIKEPPYGPGFGSEPNCICADFAHDKEGSTKTGYYRVHFNDLAILLANWNIKEPPHGPGIEPSCLDCP